MKTIRKWLEELPEPDRSNALRYAEEAGFIDDIEPSLAEALKGAFYWLDTPEGALYWGLLADSLEKKPTFIMRFWASLFKSAKRT
jgi:hypothetical protein